MFGEGCDMTTRRAARVLAAVVTLALATALATPAAAADGTAPKGYTATAIAAAGLSVAVPDSWLKIDPTSQSAEDALQAAAGKNPQLSGLVAQFEQIRGSISYWAIDTGSARFTTNLLVLPTDYQTSALRQPAAVEQSLRASLGSDLIKSLSVAPTKVDGRSSLRARAKLGFTALDGKPGTAYATILLVPTKRGVVDLDYTGTVRPAKDKTLATIVRSIQVH
jgi:hypothetical protein